MKKTAISLIIIFVGWIAINFLVHGMYLMETYEQTPQLWRPMEEIKATYMDLANFIVAVGFVVLYCALVSQKSMKNALIYGSIFGIIQGVGMGMGTYSYMPISCFLAWAWGLSELAKYLFGGIVLGLCCKPE